MSSGIGMIGRDVTLTVGAVTIVGTSSKGLTFTNEALETTDDDSSGWQEFLAKPGTKSAEFSMSGLVKNLGLLQSWFGSSQIFEVIVTYTDGSIVTFDGFLESYSDTGEQNQLYTFDATLKSSGVIVFTAGV